MSNNITFRAVSKTGTPVSSAVFKSIPDFVKACTISGLDLWITTDRRSPLFYMSVSKLAPNLCKTRTILGAQCATAIWIGLWFSPLREFAFAPADINIMATFKLLLSSAQ
ncbi:hypothetical protein BCON_0659g00020 [Botryotinia convoluta]|uniref:Uncharacterized protein n=1 Tax=Botryotinia convoluta TaxID=54673 RepID=A0A4Z1H968_9HELO|nr:hypothetical protein BCON_0659g00020 [Botryotinia convoluta]